MSQYLNRWRLPALAVLTALAVATASQAFAQGQPGESNFYTVKQVHTAGDLKTEGTMAEARNNGNLLSAWKANDSTNQVWLSYNNGSPFTILPTTKTFVSPAVVPIGPSNFLVFHTMNEQQEWSSPINLGGGLALTASAICLNNTGSSLGSRP